MEIVGVECRCRGQLVFDRLTLRRLYAVHHKLYNYEYNPFDMASARRCVINQYSNSCISECPTGDVIIYYCYSNGSACTEQFLPRRVYQLRQESLASLYPTISVPKSPRPPCSSLRSSSSLVDMRVPLWTGK